MFSKIRKRITYTNLAVTVALVFAMTGGAYAASKYVITSTKQISPKVLKSLKGAKGANGKNGANGPTGAQGAPGAQGPQGAAGATGAKGETGTEGKTGASVTSGTLREGDKNCKAGGSEFKAGSTATYACNGSPWTAGGLPKGASETGTWTIYEGEGATIVNTSLSFSVPLAGSLDEEHVHFIAEGEGEGEGKEAPAITSKECGGTHKEPKAASGNLCVFTKSIVGLKSFAPVPIPLSIGNAESTTLGAGKSGAYLIGNTAMATEQIIGDGDWVVTG